MNRVRGGVVAFVAALGMAVPGVAQAGSLAPPVLAGAPDAVTGKPSLTWTPVPGAAGYRVRRSPGTFPDDPTCQAALNMPPNNRGIAVLPATQTTYLDAGVGGGVWTYAVWTYDGVAGGTTVSLSNCISLSVAAPPTMGTLSVRAVGTTGTATLDWSVSGQDTFTIRRVDGSSPPADASSGVAACGGPPSSAPPCTDTGLVVGGTYTYQAFASNAVGPAQSNAVTIRVNPPPPPPPPSGFGGTIGDGQVALRWSVASGVTYTLVGQPGTSAPADPNAGTAYCGSPSARPCTVVPLPNDQPISFALFAHNANGYSTPVRGTFTPHDSTPPPMPTNFHATAGDGVVALSWSPVGGDVVAYGLSFTPSAPGAQGCATLVATDTSCVVAGLQNGTTYTFSLVAMDEARPPNVSQRATSTAMPAARPGDTTPPPPPGNLRATPGDHSALLQWDGVGGDVAGYRIVAAIGLIPPSSPDWATRVCDGLGATGTSCVITGIQNDVTYTFSLWAYDLAGNFSSPPAAVSVTPRSSGVALPPGGSAAAPSGPATPIPLAGGVPVASPAVVDRTPPGRPRSFRARLASQLARITWANPTDADFAFVYVVRNARHRPTRPQDGLRLYQGKLTRTSWKPPPGTLTHLAIFAYDRAGNISSAVYADVRAPRAVKLLPASGSTLKGSPLMRWVPVKGAAYYNVQVFQGKRRVAIAWPTTATWKLPGPKLRPGTTYIWYVWPGLGPRKAAKYGKLVGAARFRYSR